eukprot:CAMPEP_0169264794 /NCGR_PEP_ID=MMETSP1016-20121227/45323_2 /TAXON_ID=342587 /ORGANISM="Karlodinium micrum, Strain CCMP2283" /LENGTH=89 /DNA_ID=CAMNT_0009348195 /DNA_START=291 /DNA_END=560 /DNA_ORIENTATION=-
MIGVVVMVASPGAIVLHGAGSWLTASCNLLIRSLTLGGEDVVVAKGVVVEVQSGVVLDVQSGVEVEVTMVLVRQGVVVYVATGAHGFGI